MSDLDLFTDLVTRKLISGDGGAVTLPKATAVFDADDSRVSGALARINGKMLAVQSRIAKFAAAFIAIRAVVGVVTAGFDHLSLRRPCDERSAFVEARCRAVHSSRRSMLTTMAATTLEPRARGVLLSAP